jgi:hypothetical protein
MVLERETSPNAPSKKVFGGEQSVPAVVQFKNPNKALPAKI